MMVATDKAMRVCLDRAALRQLARDGMGWGHDLDCGCLHVGASPARGRLARLIDRISGRAR